MNWGDTAEQAAFRRSVRRFVRDAFPASYLPEPDAENGLEPEDVGGYNWPADVRGADPTRAAGARDWAAALARRGWIAPQWPRRYGGAGLSAAKAFVLHEEVLRAGKPGVNGLGVFLLGPTLLVHGTAVQRAEHLPPTARGERVWAQGFSEPEAGSDLAGLRTRAVREGEHYVVNGQKVWTSLGQHADWLFVLVRTGADAGAPRHHGITFLLVDARSPGVTVRPLTDIRGAAPFCEIFFEDVRVPVGNRVGEEGRGWYVAMDTLSFERAGLGAGITFDRTLTGLIAHLATEHGPEQLHEEWDHGLRGEVARRYIEVQVSHHLARYTASREPTGAVPGYEASVSQLFNAELHQRLARTGRRAFGANSLLWRGDDAPMAGAFTHLSLDAVAATFMGGTSEIQRNVIATRGLGLPSA
ncbi:acyl-CoA dehydrogenase family protein [Streptomyces sp. NPDC059788]|uniref:acyl-CoA dehydrogenase family protein n=1 Tax=Streptomyces sp. NPDC059788 TaxID=3346948 RepID=UPI0036563CCC